MHGRRGCGKQVWKAKTTSGLLFLNQGKLNSCVRTLSFVLKIVRFLFFVQDLKMWFIYGAFSGFGVGCFVCCCVFFVLGGFLAFEVWNKNPFSKLPFPSSVTQTLVYKQFYETAQSLTAGVLKDSRKSAFCTIFPKKRFIFMLCCIFMQNAIKKCLILSSFYNVLQTM